MVAKKQWIILPSLPHFSHLVLDQVFPHRGRRHPNLHRYLGCQLPPLSRTLTSSYNITPYLVPAWIDRTTRKNELAPICRYVPNFKSVDLRRSKCRSSLLPPPPPGAGAASGGRRGGSCSSDDAVGRDDHRTTTRRLGRHGRQDRVISSRLLDERGCAAEKSDLLLAGAKRWPPQITC